MAIRQQAVRNSYFCRRPAGWRGWKTFIGCLVVISLLMTAGSLASAAEGKSSKKEPKKSEKSEKKPKEKEKKNRSGEDAAKPPVQPPPLAKLWEQSQELLRYGEPEDAAQALFLVHYYYPNDPKGEPSLWQSALLQKEIALTAKNPDWDSVLERFRRYLNYYPKSSRAAEAYFELGQTYQAMRFYREAQAYFKLFLERYPNSPLVLPAMRWYRDSILREGHRNEAQTVFKAWLKSPEAKVRAMGEMGLAALKSGKGDYPAALESYQKILTTLPDYPVIDPEILRYAGIANLRQGQIDAGRDQLYHYLSLTGASANRADVLLELAESYFAAGDYQAAQKLYNQIKAEGGGDERAVLVANLRLALILDDNEITLSQWQRHNDLKDTEGDKPYIDVLEKLYRDPVAQDARFGIFKRYQARGELARAYEVGRNFLRTAVPDQKNALQTKRIGAMLTYLVGESLKAKKYVGIYDLYVGEYRHIKDFPNGTLQAMIGEAMEALNLNQQAAALYYRAMQWPLGEQEKTDLYFRRARLYMAMKDYDADDRLLTYLEKIYQGKPEAGDVAYYRAKLSAARGDTKKAEVLYQEALDKPSHEVKRSPVTNEAIDLLVKDGQLEQAEAVLAKGAIEGSMTPGVQQEWLLEIGNKWREKKEWGKARTAYEKGLAESMPAKGEAAQALHLYLGDTLFALGSSKEGLAQYQAAAQGDTLLWKQMAKERLTQYDLDTEMAAMQKGAQPAAGASAR